MPLGEDSGRIAPRASGDDDGCQILRTEPYMPFWESGRHDTAEAKFAESELKSDPAAAEERVSCEKNAVRCSAVGWSFHMGGSEGI